MVNFYQALMRWAGLNEDGERRTVSLKEAMGLPPVWYAHSKICGDFAQLPIDVKKRSGDGAVNDERHYGYYLLREQPNKVQSPTQFKEQFCSHAIMYGNGRAAIIRSGQSVQELIPLMPDRTRTILHEGEKYHVTKPNKSDNRDLLYDFNPNEEGYVVLHDSEVIHMTGFTYDGVEGVGLMQLHQNVLSIGYNAQKFLDNQNKKGFRGKLFLEAPPGAFRNEAQAREFMELFNKAEAGSDNSGKAGLLREGIKANAVSQTNNDAQFVELAKFTRQDVGMLFGMDSMPGDGDSVSYNSLEQHNLSYLRALDRWLVKFEEQCDMKLRTPPQKLRGSHYYKFNRAAILRTDFATTMSALANAITHRIMSPNEARAKLDMNPYEGGDEYANPAVTPGSPGDSEPDDAEDESPAESSATEAMLRSLITTEANNAISGAKSKNFCSWIEKNYAKWEPKLADKLEEIGIDRDLARVHCDESKQVLLDLAGRCTLENLLDTVTAAVKDWPNRSHAILGAMKCCE